MTLVKYQGSKESNERAETHANGLAKKIEEKTGIGTNPKIIVNKDIESGAFRLYAFGKSILVIGYDDLGANGPETMKKIEEAYEKRTEEYVEELYAQNKAKINGEQKEIDNQIAVIKARMALLEELRAP